MDLKPYSRNIEVNCKTVLNTITRQACYRRVDKKLYLSPDKDIRKLRRLVKREKSHDYIVRLKKQKCGQGAF